MITYTNRKGDTYFLKQGLTKTEKPRYYASTKLDQGINGQVMPEGFEFHENVNGQVSVRKSRPCKINPDEVQVLEKALSKLDCATRVEAETRCLTIYTSDVDERFIEDSPLLSSRREMCTWIRETAAYYSPLLQFCLFDEEKRLFHTARMCFMGREPGWLPIGDLLPLQACMDAYVPLLDDEEALFEILD